MYQHFCEFILLYDRAIEEKLGGSLLCNSEDRKSVERLTG